MIYLKHLILILLGLTLVKAEQPYWVFLEDDLVQHPVTLTEKAEQRIALRGAQHPSGNHPVSLDQLDQLRAAGFKLRHSSRFLNAVSLEVESRQDLELLKQLPFTRSVRKVARQVTTIPQSSNADYRFARIPDSSYGRSLTQNELLHIPLLHGFGYDGSGVTIGVFDTGFLTDHPVFDQLDIRDQYDFVDQEPNPSGVGHDHGINTLSILGGYYSEELIGPAYGATYLLARTEDVNSETRAEEDNWVAALEWADSLGVDIISSSLSYRLEHDDPSEDYPDSAMDGETTVITRAANIAAERGILVVNSASNEGPGPMSIWAPSDSRHVLAVGAISSYGDITNFSSRGPTFDGRIKPDVVAMGIYVYMASSINQFQFGLGTSFSAPQISGLAALLLQAHPELTPDSVISLFRKNGDRATTPDNAYGYGLPDLRHLFPNLKKGIVRNSVIYPNPTSALHVKMVLEDPVAHRISQGSIFDINGRFIAPLSVQVISETLVELTLPPNQVLADQLLILAVQADGQTFSGKLVYIKS